MAAIIGLARFMDEFYRITEHPLFRAALATLVISCFGIYQKLNDPDAKADILMTRFDNRIPFWPAFSMPYLLYLPYLLLVVIYGIVASPYYAHIAASMLAVQLAAAAIYNFRQTHVPRPAVTGTGVFNRLTSLIYSYDRPYCAFPSLHVAYSLLCAYWSFFLFPHLFPLLALLTAAIVASTVFLKQHALADVFAGGVLMIMCVVLVG